MIWKIVEQNPSKIALKIQQIKQSVPSKCNHVCRACIIVSRLEFWYFHILFYGFENSTRSFLALTHGNRCAALCTAVVLPVQSDLRADAELVRWLVADLWLDARLGDHVHTLAVAAIIATWKHMQTTRASHFCQWKNSNRGSLEPNRASHLCRCTTSGWDPIWWCCTCHRSVSHFCSFP